MVIKNFKYNLVSIPTIGDGSCLIHSVLQAFNTDYQKMTSSERMKLAKNVRKDLSAVLDYKLKSGSTVYQNLSRGELGGMSEEIDEASMDYMKDYLDSRQYLTFHYIELLSEIFDLNIIIVSQKEKDFYYTGDHELLIKKRDTIFVNYIDQTHFETMGLSNGSYFTTLFNFNTEIVDDAVKLLYKRVKNV